MEWLTIFAILLGPILAVQTTRIVDIRRARRERRLHVYRVLMATRAASLSAAHVEALNSIDLEFNGSQKADVAVVRSWKAYLDHLSDRSFAQEQ